ncbi:hypothetical protein FisN_4Lh044 [Fistulifera solaris]|uniref:Uncharacterized protein n=1 Tax=Fistulifera solaris TaxID=1519565 RepID=A0A1Z5KD80_FISSO|nr:hypothetical protein FisN_4Lh044 [Fistulifera solaris]|eukprot:GAX24254.1 hypothetical protein FisN_4Lh044 [Fistulifera solaris]
MADPGEDPGVARLPNEEQVDTDAYENLELSFDDIEGEDLMARIDPPRTTHEPDDLKKKAFDDFGGFPDSGMGEDYILGTLIVRVVAARGLESVGGGGFGKLLFGGDARNPRSSGGRQAARKAGSPNPYASVRFGTTTQRTSEVYNTVDPIWPRGESMYMDVVQPKWEQLTGESSDVKSSFSSDDSLGKQSNKIHYGKTSREIVQKHREMAKPILTVAVFHASEGGKTLKFPDKSQASGDSDDKFLGMTAIDLTELITGKIRSYDEWLSLNGSKSDRAEIRIYCEYEPSDGRIQAGDMVRFTDYCHPADIYPLLAGQKYKVAEVEGDDVIVSHVTPEGWMTSFCAHRNMLICEERHVDAIDVAHDELASITARLAHSPLMETLSQTVQRLPDEGLVNVGVDAVRGGAHLLTRWLENGLGTALGDIAYATNWDGRFNPDIADTLSTTSLEEDDASSRRQESLFEDRKLPAAEVVLDTPDIEPLPNMPACPITGEPMREPVVAADGHTYERSAIARWLQASDKSPLTGSVLLHKNLVPNYMLLSSLQEANDGRSSATCEEVVAASVKRLPDDSLDEATAEVNID